MYIKKNTAPIVIFTLIINKVRLSDYAVPISNRQPFLWLRILGQAPSILGAFGAEKSLTYQMDITVCFIILKALIYSSYVACLNSAKGVQGRLFLGTP